MTTQQPDQKADQPQAGTAPGNGGGAAPTTEPAAARADSGEVLRQELEGLRLKLAEAQDRALRIQADADNQRKRMARDVENAHKYGLERLVADLIPVVDSLELGIEATGTGGPDLENLRQGMDLTLKKFLDTLARFGVTAINPQGEKFNPDRHEAVSAQSLEGAEPNTIISVMQKGYELNGRLVRPAMVVIVKPS
jgi:molecular chaperone GrpE